MKKALATILVFVLLLSCLPAALAAGQDILTRGETAEMLLKAADDYNPGVRKSDILKGYPDGSLHEEESVTRAQALVMLERAFGELPEPAGAYASLGYDTANFTDIPSWAEEELANVLQSGIVAGTSATTFDPNIPVTREQMELFIRRVYALEGSNLKDDFYATVNHEYLTTTTASGLALHGPFRDLSPQVTSDLDDIIREIVQTGGSTAAEKKIATLYDNYMDWDSRNAAGLTPIQPYLDAIDAASSAKELMAADVQIAEEQGAAILVKFDWDISAENSNEYVWLFNVYTPFLGQGGYADADEDEKGIYLRLVSTFLEISGETPEEAQRQAQLCWDTESALSDVMLNVQDSADVSKINNLYTMEQLRELFPAMDLPALLAANKLKEEKAFRVSEVKLTEACASLFRDENLDAMKALFRFGLLREAANYLTLELYDTMQAYKLAAEGRSWDLIGSLDNNTKALLYASMASDLIKDLTPTYLEQAYVARYCSAEVKADVEKMLRDLIDTFHQRIEKLDWMNDATKEGAYRKLDAIRIRVAYPDEWDAAVESMSILPASKGGGLYQNWVEVQKAQQTSMAARQGTQVDKDEWNKPAYSVNATYFPGLNGIEVYAGVLQAPLYDVNASYEENLGGIGYVLAHEISHAFDNDGAKFDENGNVADWWTEEDYAVFQDLCRKVVAFYDGKECAPGITCDGEQTLSENIADLGSIACLTQIVSQLEEPDFETLYRTVASTWSMVTTRERLALFRSDIHPPDALRSQLPLQTCDEFYETFGITEGDGMWIPPGERVSIW